MPTLRRDACVSAGKRGESGDVDLCRCEMSIVLASRCAKKDVIEGWYWRLRMWPLECVTAGMVVVEVGELRGRRMLAQQGGSPRRREQGAGM